MFSGSGFSAEVSLKIGEAAQAVELPVLTYPVQGTM